MPDWALEIAPLERIVAGLTDPVRTVITPDGWKLNLSPLGEHELYNLNDDQSEVNNLAKDLELHPMMNELGARIGRWQRRTADTVVFPATLYDS
jgi:hypothetical protein